jgi:glycosyltransferase involved in cell wall biosynthesis
MKKMVENQISILLPTFNSLTRFDGDSFLPFTLNSIVNQNYNNFELIILDNQSNDGTLEYLTKFAKQESQLRIKVISDTKRRFAEEAISHLVNVSNFPYCIFINDDDYWDKDLLSHYNAEINAEKHDLYFVNGYFVDENDKKTCRIINDYVAYNLGSKRITKEERFVYYFRNRPVLPIIFGMFNKNKLVEALPMREFDKLKANVDNRFLLDFLANESSVRYSNRKLFFYRKRRRFVDPRSTIQPNPLDLSSLTQFYILHQINFLKTIIKDLDSKELGRSWNLDRLEFGLIVGLLENIIYVCNWIRIDYCNEPMKKKQMHQLLKELIALYIKVRFRAINKRNSAEKTNSVHINNLNQILVNSEIGKRSKLNEEIKESLMFISSKFSAETKKVSSILTVDFFYGLLFRLPISIRGPIKTVDLILNFVVRGVRLVASMKFKIS